MPDFQSHSFGPSPGIIERPSCPRCQTRMSLARIAPGPGGYDMRTFECTKCAYVHKALVAMDDPMKSDMAGWQYSRLKAPD